MTMANLTFKSLSEQVAKEEGLRKELDIAQIKEVVRITLGVLSNARFSEVAKLLENYQK